MLFLYNYVVVFYFFCESLNIIFVDKYQKIDKYKLRLSKHQGRESSVTEYFVEHNSDEHRLQNYKVVLMQEQLKQRKHLAHQDCHLFSLALSPLLLFITSSAAQWLCI